MSRHNDHLGGLRDQLKPTFLENESNGEVLPAEALDNVVGMEVEDE